MLLTEEAVSILLKQKERNEWNLTRSGNQTIPSGMEGMTMDLYVHVAEDEKMKEMESIQSYIKLV